MRSLIRAIAFAGVVACTAPASVPPSAAPLAASSAPPTPAAHTPELTKPPDLAVQPSLPAPTSMRWAVDRGSPDDPQKRDLLVLFYTGVAQGWKIVDARGDLVLRVPIAGSGIFSADTCVSRERRTQEAVTWLAVDRPTLDAFIRLHAGYHAVAEGVGQQPLELADSGCRGPISSSTTTPIPRPGSDPTLPQWAPAPGSSACRTVRDPLPPAGAICVTVARGDLDGDGVEDRAVVWGDLAPAPREGGRQEWHLAAVTSRGTKEILIETPFFEAALRGIIDVNADGRGQILMQVDRGASTERWRAFALVDGSLQLLQVGERVPLEIPVYGSVMHGSRFECVQDAANVRLLSLMSFSGRDTGANTYVFDWFARNYRVRGAAATLVGTATGTATRAEMDDRESDFSRTWRNCGVKFQT